jgi:hypothetical protein
MKKDILDLLPEEQLSVIEGDAYAMLHRHGYAVKGARKDGRVRTRLKNALQRRGHELVYSFAPFEERGVFRLVFVLRAIGGDEIDRTKTFRLVLGGAEGEKKEESNEDT